MSEKKHVMTRSGAEKLELELRERKEVRRAEIAAKLKDARAQGDLSENAEYDAAKDERDQNESRIAEIEIILKNAEIVEDSTDSKTVSVGSKVTIREDGEDEDEVYYIVGSTEASSRDGKISAESPLGAALMGKKVRNVVTFEAPAGTFKYKIVKIEKA